jgi:hypothetical protein
MASITITAANVVAGSNATRAAGSAGEAITAGQVVYFDASVNKWRLADNNLATLGATKAGGIALNAASLNQPVDVQTSGDITIGGTLVAGTAYYLAATAGAICPFADLVSTNTVCELGLAKSATVLSLGIQFPGVTL